MIGKLAIAGQESKKGRVSKMTSGCMRSITRWKKVSFTEIENPRICLVRAGGEKTWFRLGHVNFDGPLTRPKVSTR